MESNWDPEYLWPNAISADKTELMNLIELSQFCICKDWNKGLLFDDLIRLNLQHFEGELVTAGKD
jgi:hypothetical protein